LQIIKIQLVCLYLNWEYPRFRLLTFYYHNFCNFLHFHAANGAPEAPFTISMIHMVILEVIYLHQTENWVILSIVLKHEVKKISKKALKPQVSLTYLKNAHSGLGWLVVHILYTLFFLIPSILYTYCKTLILQVLVFLITALVTWFHCKYHHFLTVLCSIRGLGTPM